jgi:hypothetical protein
LAAAAAFFAKAAGLGSVLPNALSIFNQKKILLSVLGGE